MRIVYKNEEPEIWWYADTMGCDFSVIEVDDSEWEKASLPGTSTSEKEVIQQAITEGNPEELFV